MPLGDLHDEANDRYDPERTSPVLMLVLTSTAISFGAIAYSIRAFAIGRGARDERASLHRSIHVGTAMFTLISMILAYRRQVSQLAPAAPLSGGNAANDQGIDRSDVRAA